jgi:hypothetical protein
MVVIKEENRRQADPFLPPRDSMGIGKEAL